MSKRSLPKIPKKKILLGLGVVLVMTAVLCFHPQIWPGGLGIGKDQSVTTKSIETVVKDAQGNTTKTVETTKIDDGKTLWDWLSLLGVPVSLAVLGYVLQQLQQKRAEVLAKEQREIAADETKEEVLQVYFDRLSVLLVDKNLLAIGAKHDQATDEERELLASAMDVIRARTLSILRRFEHDPERKTSVIRFLIEADFVSKLKLDLSDADLSRANLSGADLSEGFLRCVDLSHTNLSHANLSKADLYYANLSDVNLTGANLNDANLGGANLTGANLFNTNLSGANLNRANLNGADLKKARFIGARLGFANLSGANLSGANLNRANLSFADLSGADLHNAQLAEANLTNAKLSSTNLSFANLFEANLTHANLSETHNLASDYLDIARLCHTKIPEGITLNPNRDCDALGFREVDPTNFIDTED
jgi:uncharacterized protein YjbI with pentapeptide repeats